MWKKIDYTGSVTRSAKDMLRRKRRGVDQHHELLVDDEDEETSIFGQTAGSANATWVECDRCKKVSFVDLLHSVLVISLKPKLMTYMFNMQSSVETPSRRSRRPQTPLQMVLLHEQERPRTI